MKNVIIFLISIGVIVGILSIPSGALKESWQYKEGECELTAKDYQRIYGGYLIFVQPLKDSGAFDLGPYNGWFLNKAYNKEIGTYYIDYMNQRYFNSSDEILEWYYKTTDKKAVVYNINERHPPFPMVWHY